MVGRRLVLALVVAAAVVSCAGCGMASWGRDSTDPEYSVSREYVEAPVGAVVLPVGFAVDLSITITTTVVLGFCNPVNWVCFVLDIDPFVPLVYVFAGTSTALTLMNPDCNLAWTEETPRYAVGMMWRGEGYSDEPEARPTPAWRKSYDEKKAENERRRSYRNTRSSGRPPPRRR